ncbi:hypothetical protein WISP_38602 [Willisornis vidua]|uniref:Uncharacterized protein n=1 Tax=Willisornis vidua TaxID=1566151 RepID=A0ABQ9DHM9_9PASS|nr:hypothetical protein WISP_38602 [Willisornis vidua]
MLMRTQLRWAGHVSRMEDHRLLKIVLYGELATVCCKRGVPKKRCKDSLKQYLSLGHIDCHQWSTLASNPDSWKHPIMTLLLPLRTHGESVSRRKDNAERTIPCQYHLERRFAVTFVTRLVYPALAFLATSTLPASMGSACPKSSFAKPSHDDLLP